MNESIKKMRKMALAHDTQVYAGEFKVGTVATWIGRGQESAGRVTKVWRGLGVVDIQFPSGNFRVEVSDLQILGDNAWITPPTANDTPVDISEHEDRSPGLMVEDGVTKREHSPVRVHLIISEYADSLRKNRKPGI